MKHLFKRLHTISNVLFAIQVFSCGIALFFIRNSAPPTAIVVRNTGQELLPQGISNHGILVLVFLLSAVGVAYLIDNQRKAQGQILQGLLQKAEHYSQSSTIRLTMIVLANILAVVVAIKENNMIYMAFVAVGMLFFLYFRPTSKKFIRGYGLSVEEVEALEEA